MKEFKKAYLEFLEECKKKNILPAITCMVSSNDGEYHTKVRIEEGQEDNISVAVTIGEALSLPELQFFTDVYKSYKKMDEKKKRIESMKDIEAV